MVGEEEGQYGIIFPRISAKIEITRRRDVSTDISKISLETGS